MQTKTIKSVLKNKINDWISSIEDKDLVTAIKKDVVVSGGSIASMLTGQEVNDYDIYFKTHDTTLAVAKYYVEKFKENPPSKFKNDPNSLVKISVMDSEERVKIIVKSQGIAGEEGTESYRYFESVNDPSEPGAFVEDIVKQKEEADQKEGKPKYRPVFLTGNAISLSDKIQLIIRFYGPINEIHENFDFIHCTCAWEYATGELTLPTEALVALMNKRLKYKRSKYPLCSFIRTRKFLKLGWSIDAGQYVKMAWDLNKLDLNNIETLEDQLIGVDSAYFMEVISLLKIRTDEGKQIDDSYLIQCIDKIFG